MIKKLTIVICAAVVTLFVARFFALHQVNPAKLDALDEGLSEKAVEAILGKPTSISTNTSQWTKWRYDRVVGVYCEVVLDFDNHGKYRGRFHDH
jgi:hypothetical protein